MKINSVELMRTIRDRMSQETQGMSWLEERDYLRRCCGSLDGLLKTLPNKAIQPTPKPLRGSGSADG